jgi:hypothetical protein
MKRTPSTSGQVLPFWLFHYFSFSMPCRKSPNPPFQWTRKKPRAAELIRYLFDPWCDPKADGKACRERDHTAPETYLPTPDQRQPSGGNREY